MAYSTGMLRDRVTVLNRREQKVSKFGVDGDGVDWEEAGTVWAAVEWTRGKSAMTAGALDVYGVIMVRMRWNELINMRSRIRHDGTTYQVLPETFHASRQDNTIQLQAQAIVNDV